MMAQDPGKPHFIVSSRDSRLAKGTKGAGGRSGADPQSSDSPNQDLGLKRNVKSLNITHTHYPDSLIFFFDISFSRF